MTQNIYKYYDNLIIRTPLLPLKHGEIDLDEIFKISKENFFKEAIYTSSPVLYKELIKWHSGDLTNKKDIDRLIISITKYYLRMQSRCTPYGLFAANSIASWGRFNRFQFNSKVVERKTSLDMTFMGSLIQCLNTKPSIQFKLKFYPNNSIYIIGNKLNYVEYYYGNGKRNYLLSSIDYNEYIEYILLESKDGITIDELVNKLISTVELKYEEAEIYAKDIINNQILISELEPCLTGNQLHNRITKALTRDTKSGFNDSTYILNKLKKVSDEFKVLDKKLGNSVHCYEKIYNELKGINETTIENDLFKIDIYRPNEKGLIDEKYKIQIDEVILFLNRIGMKNFNPQLDDFKKRFFERYKSTEVSLLEVLDKEIGIGYCNDRVTETDSFIQDLTLKEVNDFEKSKVYWDLGQSFLHQYLITTLKNGAYEVNFEENDFRGVNNTTSLLPDSLSVIFKVINDKSIYIQSIGGISAANIIARFANNNDKILNITTDIANHEKELNQDKILTEIVHLPTENKASNISLRPLLRDYEISYLGQSGLSDIDKVINVDDIMVSLIDDKLMLRSKRLNKQIIPRLTTAHNYFQNSLPVYQFLCDMQHEYAEKSGLSFNWGVLSDTFKFLPRVLYKGTIIHAAKWQFNSEDFQLLTNCQENKLLESMNEFRKKWRLPKYANIVNGDNELLINFENLHCVKIFINEIKNRNHLVLSEFLFEKESMIFKDELSNVYANECVAILLKKDNHSIGKYQNFPKTSNNEEGPEPQRVFLIGSQWLSYKFFCGCTTSETILNEVILPLTKCLIAKKLIFKFFFSRITKTHSHIELNLNVINLNDIGGIINIVNEYSNESVIQKLLHKIQLDQYTRDFELYGKTSINSAEDFLYVDSQFALRILKIIRSQQIEEIRWIFALKSVDDLLETFGYTDNKKIEFLERLVLPFNSENHKVKVEFDIKYRDFRRFIEDFDEAKTREVLYFKRLIIWRTKHLKSIINKLERERSEEESPIILEKLIESYINSIINRLFKSNHEIYKASLLNFLYRHCKSLLARNKYLMKTA